MKSHESPKFPEWRKPCEDALSEPDAEEIFQRVIVAEAAIFHRLEQLTSSVENDELEAIDAMLNSLRRLVINSCMFRDRMQKGTVLDSIGS